MRSWTGIGPVVRAPSARSLSSDGKRSVRRSVALTWVWPENVRKKRSMSGRSRLEIRFVAA
jgi:hypothetical protein